MFTHLNLICDMKNICKCVLLALVCAMASCKGDVSDTQYTISFPTAPVTLFTNGDVGKLVVNYFNIVKIADNQFRMYYSGEELGDELKDFNNNLYVAFSNDLVHWTHENPNGGDNVIMKNLVDQSVCYLEGEEYPYRLIANVWEDEKYKMCMWFSKDGLQFGNRKVVLEDMMHDSQAVVVPGNGFLKLYLRKSIKLGPGNYNRRIALCYLDMEGNCITDMALVAGERLYNSAASKIDNGVDLLLPTYFNNEPGLGDPCHFVAYVQDGLYSQPIDCGLNAWIDDDEKWAIVAPGIVQHDGKQYVAYYTRNTSHDAGRVDISTYKLVEIKIDHKPFAAR